MGSSALLRDFPGWARADTLDLRDVGNPDLCPLEELHLLPEKHYCSLTSAMFVVGGSSVVGQGSGYRVYLVVVMKRLGASMSRMGTASWGHRGVCPTVKVRGPWRRFLR